MPKYELTDEAKSLARELRERVLRGQIKRDLHIGVGHDHRLHAYNKDANEIVDLFESGGGTTGYGELQELVSAGFLKMTPMSGIIRSFRITQRLDDAVASDFEIPAHLLGSHVNIGSANTVHIDNANITALLNDTDKLVDVLTERLRTVLREEHAFIFQDLEELRTAVDDAQKLTIVQRVWNNIDRVASLATLVQLLAGR